MIGDRAGDEVETDSIAEPELLTRSRVVALSGIERFTLLKKLGEGGMGSVYAAYDITLDRKVALKVVRSDRRHASGPIRPRDQLLREAQAMARLSHPNVVAVHEVGELGEGIYVVLELVDGTTLAEWIRERSRGWREIVAAFIQAGRGLAAAHDAGLVHRDFKPANVLVWKDGRIQVTDFGVVSMGGSSDSSLSGEPRRSVELTYAGRRVGTLAYMAPEQHALGAVDARADQFSFCVSLWEGLYRERPFTGDATTLPVAVREGRIAPPPVTARVPRWIELALRRGLSPRADDRWPSIEALLDELGRDPSRVRRRRLIAAATSVGIAAIAVVAWLGWFGREPAIEPCTGAGAHLAQRWGPDRAVALRAAFAASNAPFATTAANHVVAELDAWAPRWVAMRNETCRATLIGEQSEVLLDARIRCLDRQLDEVAQLVAALETSDRGVIARVAQQLGLPDVAVCADRDVVMARVPPPGATISRARVDRIEHELAGIRAAERTGRYHDARVRAVAIATEALQLELAPLSAEALLVRGRLEEQDGDLAAARATLATAAQLAGIARDDRMLARTLVTLLGVLIARAEFPAAIALGIAARAATARAGEPALEAELAEQLGSAYAATGDAEAEPQLRRALALREAEGRETVAVAQVVNKLASLDAGRRRSSEARAGYERALRIVTAQLGPMHPATAVTQANLCFLDAEAGQLAPARACQEKVLGVLERALGSDHPQVAWALNEVALVQREQGELDGAEARFSRALAIWERASGPTHPDVAWPLINLGEVANSRGDHTLAEALCRRALAIVEKSKADGRDGVPALSCLAEALIVRAPREAVTTVRRAIAIQQSPDSSTALILARALAASGDRRAAIAVARDALVGATGPLRTRIEAFLREHATRP